MAREASLPEMHMKMESGSTGRETQANRRPQTARGMSLPGAGAPVALPRAGAPVALQPLATLHASETSSETRVCQPRQATAIVEARALRSQAGSLSSKSGREVQVDLVRSSVHPFLQCLLVNAQEDRTLAGLVPIHMVFAIMWMFYSSVVFLALPSLHIGFVSWQSGLWQSTFCLSLVSFHQAAVVAPGSIPEGWPKDGGCLSVLMLERKSSGELRWCSKEGTYKPDRAHFCRQLGRNVLRMDHWCPWLNTCIGHRNHKFFILFLFYALLSGFSAGAFMGGALWKGQLHSVWIKFVLAQSTVLCTQVVGILGPFFAFHLHMLSDNTTTIEFCEGRRRTSSLYDVGLYGNIQAVMGKEWYLWLMPVSTPLGDGLQWPRRPVSDDPSSGDITDNANASRDGNVAYLAVAGVPNPMPAMAELWEDAFDLFEGLATWFGL